MHKVIETNKLSRGNGCIFVTVGLCKRNRGIEVKMRVFLTCCKVARTYVLHYVHLVELYVALIDEVGSLKDDPIFCECWFCRFRRSL